MTGIKFTAEHDAAIDKKNQIIDKITDECTALIASRDALRAENDKLRAALNELTYTHRSVSEQLESLAHESQPKDPAAYNPDH